MYGVRPKSPVTVYLDRLSRDPGKAISMGHLPTEPAGAFIMPEPTARAARRFLHDLGQADPTGERRKAGEYAQSYRFEMGQVRPNAPIAYEAGDSVIGPANPPGTFINIHSHPSVPPPLVNDFPSPQDHRGAREARKAVNQPHELLYHPDTDKFYAYTGTLPLAFYEARFPEPPAAGPGPQGHPPTR